jgi:uncharacterized SAM-binding protein YcdF (DUF218 family)
MSAVGPNGGDTPRRGGGALRVLFTIAALAAALLGGGFLWFVGSLDRTEVPLERRADAIVALTGGAFRINDALVLLATGRGQRLLITGVNPGTRAVEILRRVPDYQRWFDCCVDIDHSLNTIGNAIETKRWARQKSIKSLIVVTSNFHMPRAIAELAHQLPDVTLIPFAVISERVRVEDWWFNPSSARLLFSEYLKYIVALARIRLEDVLD